MKLIRILHDFIKKAKQEAVREYSFPSSGEEENRSKGWIGVDLDGTLARSDTLTTLNRIGDPVPKMLDRVKSMIEHGTRVKIFTARAGDPDQVLLIQAWLRENEIPNLEVTNVKDYDMIRLYDDRAVQVIANTGEIVRDDKLKL
ncbi:MAG: hypothetical protein JEZ12_08620 [Desulfobacterium sp.]|nr:hypothetical protein [Desulfobacterium sp.]